MAPPPDDEQDPDWRMTVNLLAIVAVLALLGLGFWLLRELHQAGKAQDCLSSGQRSCRQIRTP
ncbi:MAG TPA: hypothetical protein VGO06_18115 [Bosea sp. (in: a-proteobacteria)]|jgi:predicted MFS family arabinose efflux permease|uniref:hypothetical protein n=1 Tax=Bosea sp. (in: a-proteobacteria) TaxID=1871050 RepID=UPI002E157D30|nr:hypothetical protein [Bosea sp. (in: a-proteobacteria)]